MNPIERTVSHYLSSSRAKNLSPKTISGYSATLTKVFLPWCAREGVTEISQLTRWQLDKLSEELLSKSLSRWSVKTYLRVVNQLLAWAEEDGEAIAARVKIPKTPTKLVVVLSRAEIQRFEDTAVTERDKLIVRLLADTGLRVGELCKLRVADLIERGREHYLHVRGKGARDRLVPIPKLFRRLQKYAERNRPDVLSDRLFVGLRRRPGGEKEPISESGVGQMLSALAKMAGIEKRVHPHLLRHSYATYALSRGMNPVQLKDILGHSSLAMIANVYSHLSPSESYAAMARLLTDE